MSRNVNVCVDGGKTAYTWCIHLSQLIPLVFDLRLSEAGSIKSVHSNETV
jgi:hypothetical protein